MWIRRDHLECEEQPGKAHQFQRDPFVCPGSRAKWCFLIGWFFDFDWIQPLFSKLLPELRSNNEQGTRESKKARVRARKNSGREELSCAWVRKIMNEVTNNISHRLIKTSY